MQSMNPFQRTEDEYFRLKGQLTAGRITQAQFDSALKDLMLRDADGRYWMIGGEHGTWYVQDGSNWVEQNPPVAGAMPPPSYAPEPMRRSNSTMLIAAGVIVVICLLGAIGSLLASNAGILKISLGDTATPTVAPTVVTPTIAAPSATIAPTLTISSTLAQADALILQSKFADANTIFQQSVQADPTNALVFARWSRLLNFQAYLELRQDLSRLAVSNAEQHLNSRRRMAKSPRDSHARTRGTAILIKR